MTARAPPWRRAGSGAPPAIRRGTGAGRRRPQRAEGHRAPPGAAGPDLRAPVQPHPGPAPPGERPAPVRAGRARRSGWAGRPSRSRSSTRTRARAAPAAPPRTSGRGSPSWSRRWGWARSASSWPWRSPGWPATPPSGTGCWSWPPWPARSSPTTPPSTTRASSTTGCCWACAGTISEVELHCIQARLQGARLSKARRGELAAAPAGRLRARAAMGRSSWTPTRRSRGRSGPSSRSSSALGTATAVLRFFRDHGLRVPRRRGTAAPTPASWSGPSRATRRSTWC